MNNEQALNVLLQVAELAQAKGILKLNEATIVFQAVSLLAPKEAQAEGGEAPVEPLSEEDLVKVKPRAKK